MVWLLRRSHFVITDSGGLQEEVTALGKPVLVIRGTTERPEGVEAGNAVLVGTDRRGDRGVGEPSLLADDDDVRRDGAVDEPVRDGDAAQQIVDILLERARRLAS